MSRQSQEERRAFLEQLCEETGGRMGVELADELDALRRSAKRAGRRAEPDFYTLTVTVKMTREQREHYATEYSMDGGVADDVAGRLPEDIRDALSQVYWLREFASYQVSKAR